MANYGLRIKDADGNITLDITDRITRLRYSTLATAGNSGNITLDDIDGLLSVEFSIAAGSGCPHSVSRTGTTISWSPNSYKYTSSCDSYIFVFLYS